MMSLPLLRGMAFAAAVAAILDPACVTTRRDPLPVQVLAASMEPEDRALEHDLRGALQNVNRVSIDSRHEPAAVVVAGTSLNPASLPDGVPISVVTLATGPNVSVVSAEPPAVARVGLTTVLKADVRATGLAGASTVIALDHDGIEIDTLEHRWTGNEERFEARFTHVPPAASVRAMRIVARPLAGETTALDNHADVRIAVEERPFRVLVHEPRPSWGATFIRRALEGAPLFEVAALARPSRSISVRAGSPPRRLSGAALEGFDAIVVGAPEELGEPELEALSSFTRARGGAVVFVPDRRPSGLYAKRLPASGFEEILLETPTRLDGALAALRASEFAAARDLAPWVRTIASLTRGDDSMPVIVSWPEGPGRAMFSGALDAWRFREDEDGFTRFWQAAIAAAAAAAPPALEASLEPAVSTPGARVRVRATVREDRFAGARPVLPAVSARLTHTEGSTEAIRLWPTAEPGVFEGHLETPARGRYVVQVAADSMTAETVLVAADTARSALPGASEGMRRLAEATGGVVVDAGNLRALESHLAGLARPRVSRTIHPTRSAWYGLSFIGLLAAEWGLRRRRGAA